MLVTNVRSWHPSPRMSAGRPYTPTVYVVGWDGLGIVKVGWTAGRQRWTGWLGRGAEVISLTFYEADDNGLDAESAIESYLSGNYPSAFRSKEDAEPLLGGRGGGWTECYRVPVSDWHQIPTGADFYGS